MSPRSPFIGSVLASTKAFTFVMSTANVYLYSPLPRYSSLPLLSVLGDLRLVIAPVPVSIRTTM